LSGRLKDDKSKFELSSFVSTPIAQVSISRTELWCPFIGHLFRRLTSGLYYDLVHNTDFVNNIGYAFEAHIGNIINIINSGDWRILPEVLRKGRGDGKASVDWVISTEDVALFIECKFQRPKLTSKVNPEASEAAKIDLEKYGNFVAQAIIASEIDISGGFGRILPTDSRFILIVTPEDWHILNGAVGGMIKSHAADVLQRRGHDPKLLDQYAIINAGARSFEIFLQAAEKFGLREVLKSHASDRHINDFTPGFVSTKYGGRDGFSPRSIWRDEFHDLIDIKDLSQR
jgi:hypothetical protein